MSHYMGWLRLVDSLKLQVSFAEYRLFYRALLQKRPIILRSLIIVATPYYTYAKQTRTSVSSWELVLSNSFSRTRCPFFLARGNSQLMFSNHTKKISYVKTFETKKMGCVLQKQQSKFICFKVENNQLRNRFKTRFENSWELPLPRD